MNQFQVCSNCYIQFDSLLDSLTCEISKNINNTNEISKNMNYTSGISEYSNNQSSDLLNDLNQTLNKFLKKVYSLLNNKNVKNYIKKVIGNRKNNNLKEKIKSMKKVLATINKKQPKRENFIKITDNEKFIEKSMEKSDIEDLLSNIKFESIEENSMDFDILDSNRNIPLSKRKYKNKLDKIIKKKNKTTIDGIKEKFLKTISYKTRRKQLILKNKFSKKTLKGKSIIPKIDDLDISHLKKYNRPQTSHLTNRKFLSLLNDFEKKKFSLEEKQTKKSLLSNKSEKKKRKKKKPMTLFRLILSKKKNNLDKVIGLD